MRVYLFTYLEEPEINGITSPQPLRLVMTNSEASRRGVSEVWPFSLGNHLENTCHLVQSAQLQRRRESSQRSRTTVRQVKTILHSLGPAGPAHCSATWGATGLWSVAPGTPHKHSPQLSLSSWWTRMLTQ